jgi:hypothetical protein
MTSARIITQTSRWFNPPVCQNPSKIHSNPHPSVNGLLVPKNLLEMLRKTIDLWVRLSVCWSCVVDIDDQMHRELELENGSLLEIGKESLESLLKE